MQDIGDRGDAFAQWPNSILGPKDRFVLVIGSGSVATANIPGLSQLLCNNIGRPIVVNLTRQAQRFVTTDTVKHLGRVAAIVDDETPTLFDVPNHIWMATQADGILVYPASAGFIAKMANGLALDVASTTILAAFGVPTMVVPSMNPQMWRNPLVQRNVKALEEIGMSIICTGDGIAPEVSAICRDFRAFFQS